MGNLPAEWWLCETVAPEARLTTMGRGWLLPAALAAELLAVPRAINPAADPLAYIELAMNCKDPCIWLDPVTKLCKHYDYRPDVCRDAVLPGDAHCLHDRKVMGIDPTTRYTLRNGKILKETR